MTFASSCFPVMHAKPDIRSPLYYRINCFSFSTCPLSLVPLPFCVMHLQRYRDKFFLLNCLHANTLRLFIPTSELRVSQCITSLSHTSFNNTGHNVSELIQLLRPKLCPATRNYFDYRLTFSAHLVPVVHLRIASNAISPFGSPSAH